MRRAGHPGVDRLEAPGRAIAYLEQAIAELEARIEAMMQPFRAARGLLMTIPGIAQVAAAAVISEIGPDPRQYFPAAAHLAPWAGLCPGSHESAGKRRHGKRRHGNITRNGGYRNPVARGKAITTVAHAILVIIWTILATGCPCQDLGAGYFARRTDPDREARRLIARLEALGKHVTVNDAA